VDLVQRRAQWHSRGQPGRDGDGDLDGPFRHRAWCNWLYRRRWPAVGPPPGSAAAAHGARTCPGCPGAHFPTLWHSGRTQPAP
jgi:hypothetical protein